MKFCVRLTALLLALCCVLGLAACSGKGGDRFRYDFPSRVVNMDPQFTTEQEGKTILANCMEGLVRQRADGGIELAAAEKMELSKDQKVYTFTLKEGLTWSDGTPLTSRDFAFGLRRMFDSGVASPYADEFASLQNGRAVLEGKQSADALGIAAPDDRTLVLTLQEPDSFFEQALCTPAALPCSEEFFRSTRGRYGLGRKFLLYNGPFAITGWSDDKLVLTRNDHYTDQVLPDQVTFYIGRKDAEQQLIDGKADAGVISPQNLQKAVDKGLNYAAYDNAVWAVVFNQKTELLANGDIRHALQMAMDRDYVTGSLSRNCVPTAAVIPPTVTLEGSETYRQAAGEALEPVYTPDAGRTLYKKTLAALDKPEPTLTLLVPEGADYVTCAGLVQQQWQQNLSLYTNIQVLPQDQYTQKLGAGEYDIALVQLNPSEDSPEGVLGRFLSTSSENVANYHSAQYDTLMNQLIEANSLDQVVELASQAEDQLINENVLVPLFLSTSYFGTGSSVRNVDYSPYSGRVLFRTATK